MTETAYDRVAQAIAAATGWRPPGEKGDYRCPAHEDGSPSLSLTRSGDKVLVHCHAGCSVEDVLAAAKLTKADLFDGEPTARNGERRNGHRELATYDYTDLGGQLAYQVVRLEPKSFRQRRPDGHGGWVWSMAGVQRVLYRLPEVVAAVAAGDPVFVVEGEKDADALHRAGYAATCNPGGAGKWHHVDFSPLLGAADVVIVRDKDPAGHKHAVDVEASLTGKVGRIRVVEAATGKDAADHLGAGHTVDDFTIISDTEPTVDPSLWPIDLGPVLAGDYTQPMPEVLARTDGKLLFYRGQINGLHGDSGTGKGWTICLLAKQEAERAGRVLILDFEDTESSTASRLAALGMTDNQIIHRLVYMRPQVPLDKVAVAHLCRLIDDLGITAVVIDSLGEAFSLEGINEDKDVEVGPWLRRVCRPLADTGAAVVVVDHSTKSADNPLHPSGSKRKRAAIGGASYLVEAIKPFVKDEGGKLRLTCAKDRHGNYRRGEVVADLVMHSSGSRVDLALYPPATTQSHAVPVILAARAAVKAAQEHAKTSDAPLSRESLVGLMKVKSSTDTKRGGIDYAVSLGGLTEETGPRNARLFRFEKELPPDVD